MSLAAVHSALLVAGPRWQFKRLPVLRCERASGSITDLMPVAEDELVRGSCNACRCRAQRGPDAVKLCRQFVQILVKLFRFEAGFCRLSIKPAVAFPNALENSAPAWEMTSRPHQ